MPTVKTGKRSIGCFSGQRHDGLRFFSRLRHRGRAANAPCSPRSLRVGFAPGWAGPRSALRVFKMEFKVITKTLVYEYAGLPEVMPVAKGHGVVGHESTDEWRTVDPELLEELFERDTNRLRRFQRYLRLRHTGLMLVRGGQWIAYGWFSNPRGAGPPHLPRSTAGMGAYWIFGCHTHERFRRRGVYKRLLERLIAFALANDPSATVLIDTHADNVASRRAIPAAGFRPRGIFSTYRVWVPVVGARIVGGKWYGDEKHPQVIGLPGGDTVSVATAPLRDAAPCKIAAGNRAANFD
jgi:RimJ/RimL family protein N-acetyltransferase